MQSDVLIPAGEALAMIERALDSVDPHRSDLPPQTRLEWLRRARRAQGRLEALTGLLTAEADKTQASVRTHGTPLASWLGIGENLSRKEAAGAVFRARALAERPLAAQAAGDGTINPNQAQAIGKVLNDLPGLDASQQAHAESVLVELAQHLDSQELARSADQVLAAVVPQSPADAEERRRQRAVATAHRQRSLRFFRDGASIRFDGSLPRLDGEAFIALVDAQLEAQRRTAIEARDPQDECTGDQRRADALIRLIAAAQHTKPAPGVGAARVIVKLDYDRLHEHAVSAGVIGIDDRLSAGELRRICCDAELVPTVLGAESEVLDVGRTQRLVTPGIRTALTVRDGGCVFPGCDVKPTLCEAHHIQPWWTGAPTALHNLALVCHHHHAVIEPGRGLRRDQWELRLGADGIAECLPPQRLDPDRRPVRHRRLGGTGRLAGTDRPGDPPVRGEHLASRPTIIPHSRTG